jgi:hypothetical protein
VHLSVSMKHFSLIITVTGLALFAGCATSPPAATPPAAQSTAQSQWENKLVRRPGSAPEDGKIYWVKDGRKHWIVNASWITAHGYKWPDDVNEIPAAELDAIPVADAIQ